MFDIVAVLIVACFVKSALGSFRDQCGPQDTSWTISGPSNEYTQIALFIITRHGDRIPQTSWPGMVEKWDCSDALSLGVVDLSPGAHLIDTPEAFFYETNIDGRQVNPGNCYQRQLTSKGYQQQIDMGEAFRKAYIETNKLDDEVDGVYIRWDSETRTKFSAQGLINGFFPVSGIENGKTQIIDTWTADSSKETMLPNTTLCPILITYELEFLKSKEFTEFYASSITPLLNQIQTIGWEADIYSIYDAVIAGYCHNMDIPEIFTDEMLENIYQAINKMMILQMQSPNKLDRTKAVCGPFLQELADSIEKYVQNEKTYKVELYSAHDITVACLLNSLNAFDGLFPPYASYVSFDLVSKENSLFIRVSYNGNELTLQGLTTAYVPVADFIAILRTYNPGDKCLKYK